ncbi:MerR family transcriptional regulator [Sphaerospermopsis sp. LEGE 00249]|uniref:MerR family transcriptional regulator n=1 Tax=Sphaerospermopsis sp. LEGE 00249 TaxID=1380707 RepID=UPI002104FB3F|nr:MerR family transcriptional regulator [Sphaerospermopsis sp. LEGE 00249]
MILMDNRFYTSTEAAEITNCSRRQLQYWRDKAIIVPTVNAFGKGRNVYYSKADLFELMVMGHLLSRGLSFEVCNLALDVLREREPWLFKLYLEEDKLKRMMLLLTGLPKYPLKVLEFDSQMALQALSEGYIVVPFWCDRLHQQLKDNLKAFTG